LFDFKIGDLVAPKKQYEQILTWGNMTCGIVVSGPSTINDRVFYYAFFDADHANVAIEEDLYEKVNR
jgi:hypothetical protein